MRERASLVLGLQASPGLQLGSYARPGLAFFYGSALLTVGFGWW